MIKKFFKKILSFAVLISMLFSSIGTVDTAYAADLSGITRSEWVSKLVSTFNMQVDDESNMPDNYFNDITSDMDCYKDILLAVEFGVIDLEAGQSFRPYDPATREFAAQTLNYCLGFKLDEGIAYTFNDSANVTYKDDAQVALNRGWFSLSNGKFCPEQAITESEMNTMLSDAVSVISGDAVSGTKNIFGVADGVIVVPETATVSIDNNGILTIGNYEGTLQTGDIFVVTLEGFPVAFQAVDVQQSDAGFIIETETNEDTDNAITSIQNEGTSDFDLEQFEVAEGATYRIVDESKGRSAGYETLSIEPYSIKYDKKSKKLTITESVKLNNVAAGTLTVAMKNIKIEQEINSGNQYAYVSMTADTDITASVKFNLNTYSGLPDNLLLGSINVGPAKLSVLMEYDLSGGMAASWSGALQVGVSYRNGNMRFLNSFHKKEFSMTSEVKLKAGVKAIAEFNFVMIKGNFWASTGVKGGFTYKVYDADTPHTCATIYGYLYVDTGYNVTVKIVGQKKEWNKTIEVYNIKNSPVRTVYHYEDDILVSSCTRGLSEAAYLTSPHSRYFSSLPGYGSSSYNWGEESVATYSYKVETDSDTGKDYASITGYTGNPSVLAIPETLDGYTVKKIANSAFAKKTSLKAVTIPDTVTAIGARAFDGCTNLSDVSLSKNLESIGCRAFASCSSLIEIEIPKSLRSASASYYDGSSRMVGGPFYNSGLTSVTFEAGTDRVVGNLFHYAEKLENVALLDTMTTIGDNAFYECKSLREIKLLNKLTAIGAEAFEDCTALESIDIPDTVTAIGARAFDGCTNLSDVSLSKNLESIGCRAFASCSSLIEIEIPKSLRSASASYYDGSSRMVGGPFYNSGLTSVTFEAGTDRVVGNLFHYAEKLENVALLDTMTTIGDNAFYECKSLREIKLLNKLTAIGAEAFEDCTALESIDIPDTVTKIGTRTFSGCNSLAAVKLSEKLKTIPSYAFNGCSSLTAIKLPENLNSIEANAFQGSGLQAVTIPASCAAVGSNAFAGCKGLATVTLQQGVKTIGSYCFKGCTALENITIPDTVESIGSYAFYDCDTLRKVVIPNSVTNMGSYIFANCEKLSDVKLGTGLTAIPQYAFYECPALKSISIPYRITTIGTKAFANCTGLAEITIPQSVTSISSDAFSYPKNMTIYGVSGSKAETFANDKGINFVAKSISATNVSLNKTELTLKKGETATLVASITPENFTDTISWRSTDTKVATVTDAGLVKGVAVGTAKIKVTVGSTSALCTVNVIQPVTSISLNKTSLTMDALNTYQLTATAYPTTAVSRDIAWSSSDSSIASVDEKGLVTAHKKGTATIKATAKDGSNISNSCKVTVSNNGYEVSKVSEFESSHPYSNNCSDIWVYTVKGATYLDLVFDAKTNIEEDFDFLYIYDANGSLIGKYTGTGLAGKRVRVQGDTAKIKLISDGAGNTWGFKVTDVKTDAAEGGIKGDINGDGSITAADMQRLYNHLNGTALLKDASIADLNEDGSVTAADMQRLYNHLNGTALLK